MTVAKTMKSPGMKQKSPKGKGPATPNIKSPKGNGFATPKGTPNVAKTPKGTPNVAKSPKGTPNVAKTPKGTPNVAKTPKGTPNVAKTPKGTPNVAKTPKGTPNVAKTPKGTPNVAKTPAATPKGPKTPSATPKGPKTPAGNPPKSTPKVANGTPKPAKAPVSSPQATLKRKRSADDAGLDKNNDVFKTVSIFNIPNLTAPETIPKLKELLEPRGEIVKCKRKGAFSLQVVFSSPEEARAAKKLNGVVFCGNNLVVKHIDDKKSAGNNKVVLSDIPHNLTDQDVWTAFGSCGKISCITMNRDWKNKHVQRCYVNFETEAGAKAALSGQKKIRGKPVSVADCSEEMGFYPIESTVYIFNIGEGVTINDVKTFVNKVAPTSGCRIIPAKPRHALVHVTKPADVDKVLKLSGTSLKGSSVTITRHRKSPLYVKVQIPKASASAPAKKQKLEVEEEEDDDDDEDDDEEEDDTEMIQSFQNKLKKLKAVEAEVDEDEDDDDDDDEDDDDEEDDDEEGGEEEEDDSEEGEDGSEDGEEGSEEEDDDEDDDDDDDDEDDE